MASTARRNSAPSPALWSSYQSCAAVRSVAAAEVTTSRRVAARLTGGSRRATASSRVEDLSADLCPGAGGSRIALVLREAPVQFGGEFGGDRQRLVGTVLSNRIPEILDELETLGDAQSAQRFEVERGASHATESENGGGGPQAGAC
jgi:hypothetical protein